MPTGQKNGALVLDYYAEPAGPWWSNHYAGVDPAFILPWRFDPEKYRVDDNEERYQTKEIVFIPNTPSPGDTVLIIARVHNFGLNPISDTVKVSFYFGDPYTGGHILYDKNTGDSVFFACDIDGLVTGIGSRGAAAAQMVWSVPADESIAECQLIYALIDPFDEISPEIHDNGDAFSNNKGWKLLNVNTTTECYDPDGDELSASAYECCVTKGDNCPDVYNPDQADSDGDGIGNACEEVVYVCGDANGDAAINLADAVYVINYVFKGGPAPDPECVGDANGDEAVNLADAVYLINYVFKGGAAPVDPCCP
jgi:hypothetical protein